MGLSLGWPLLLPVGFLVATGLAMKGTGALKGIAPVVYQDYGGEVIEVGLFKRKMFERKI